MNEDWARPVVHGEIEAGDAGGQAAFCRRLFNWEIGRGLIMPIPAGLGGPEPGPAGHIRQGEHSGVSPYVPVRDLGASPALAAQLGARGVAQPFHIPGRPTLARLPYPPA